MQHRVGRQLTSRERRYIRECNPVWVPKSSPAKPENRFFVRDVRLTWPSWIPLDSSQDESLPDTVLAVWRFRQPRKAKEDPLRDPLRLSVFKTIQSLEHQSSNAHGVGCMTLAPCVADLVEDVLTRSKLI
jgi:hypothetical protein